MDRREMLSEYFMLEVSEEGSVTGIPHLLKGYTPNLDKLPLFLMRLGPQVCTLHSFTTGSAQCMDRSSGELAI